MALSKITYDNKVSLNPQPGVAEVNKVTDANMNEIKSVVNDLVDTTTYSTTEKRIGTWTDGKPLYRQVLEADNPTHQGYPFGTLSISASQVKKIEAVCRISNGGMICMGYNKFFVQVDASNKLYYSNENYTGTKLIVIIDYTKSTD